MITLNSNGENMNNDILGILTIIAVIAVFGFFFFVKKKEGKDWVYAVYFIVILSFGTILHSLALFFNNDKDTVFSLGFVILKSLSYSIKTFGGDFYSSIFSGLARENIVFRVAFLVYYIAAILLMFIVAIKIFGKNLINWINIFWISYHEKYILIGFGRHAKIFLNNLDYNQKKRTIVILEPSQKDNMKELISSGYTVVTIKDENEILSDRKDINKETFYALKKAGALRCSNQTRVISISENDETNLLVAKILTVYITDYIKNKIKPELEKDSDEYKKEQDRVSSMLKLDACIMYSLLERSEHFLFMEKAFGKVRFFNPYEIRARKFIWDNPVTKLIPSHWIDTKKARLKNNGNTYKICNIFVGFGLTNKAILKTSIINSQLLGVDYNALILCNDVKNHEMCFRNSAIGLFDEIIDGKLKRGAEIKQNLKGDVYLESPSEKII
jgi:hypothetical protein